MSRPIGNSGNISLRSDGLVADAFEHRCWACGRDGASIKGVAGWRCADESACKKAQAEKPRDERDKWLRP